MSSDPQWYPLALDLDVAMRWYWKVREWRVEFALTRDDSGPPISHDYTDTNFVTMDIASSFGTPLSREDYAVCKANINTEQSTGTTPAGAAQLVWQMFTSDQIAVGYNSLLDKWFPRFRFGVGPPSGGFDELDTDNTGVATGAELIIDGEDPTPLYKNAGLPTVSWSGTVTITPEEFWPFGDRNNLDPVFNTATGLPIVDPFSRLPT